MLRCCRPSGGEGRVDYEAGREREYESADMDRNDVITKLRQHEVELRAAGIIHLRLHGSVARNEAATHLMLI
jgi:hypothetical protein